MAYKDEKNIEKHFALEVEPEKLTEQQQVQKTLINAKKADTLKFVSAVLTFSMICFCVIFLIQSSIYVLLGFLLSFMILGLGCAFINNKKQEALFKLFFVLLISLSVIFILFIILNKTGVLNQLSDVTTVAAFIKGFGFWGVAVFIFFVILNTVFLPIPMAVPAVVGTIIYGPLLSFIYMSIGTVIGSIIVFSLGKIFGQRIAIWMVGEEKTEKYATFLDKKGRLAFIFMMIFPFFPDDILCLIAGLSKMSYKFFIFVICPVRLIALAFTCFFVDGSIIPFSGWGIPVWITIGVVFIGAFIIIAIIKRKMFGTRINING
ncbi:MAG: VTT domain-containing protein [Firmicutes bacterium]|nr:VTT domain-containing protein [Bacillota bacterium]